MAISMTKSFLTHYVQTVQWTSAQYLGRSGDPAKIKKAFDTNLISATYQPIVLNYTYTDNRWDWSSRTTTIVNPTSTPKTEEEKKEEQAQWAVVAGVVVSCVSAVMTAYFLKAMNNQTKTTSYNRVVKDATLTLNQNSPVTTDIGTLMCHVSHVDQINQTRINTYFYVATALLAGGVALATGGFAAIPWMMTAGKIGIFVSAVFGLMTLAYNWDDSDLRQHHNLIFKTAGKILVEMNTLGEDLVTQAPAGSYDPLYENPAT